MGLFGLLAALIIGAIAFPSANPAWALQPDEILEDKSLEKRARGLSAELRCLVCQNQSIDDSDAPLARDLRLLVRERLKAGDSDNEVMSFIVDRYGEFVLLKPPFALHTLVLWLAPLFVLLGAVWLARTTVLGRSPAIEAGTATASGEQTSAALTEAEQDRLNAILSDPPPDDRR
ncbi:MAG: cytochrome c-type biogenesis protein [Pseudomonadota bacterium]